MCQLGGEEQMEDDVEKRGPVVVRGVDSQPGATLMLAAVKPCSLSPEIKTGSTH